LSKKGSLIHEKSDSYCANNKSYIMITGPMTIGNLWTAVVAEWIKIDIFTTPEN